MSRPGFHAFARAASAYARVDAAVSTIGHAARLAADGLLGAALDGDEQMRLTIELYDLVPRPYHPARGLWDWEEAWFARRLPPAPARILIGAAGAGREAVALADRGYDVTAFEPATGMCARAVAAAAGRFPVAHADYADLADAVAGGGAVGPRAHALAPLIAGTWDAFIFGWASLSHVLGPARGDALAAAARLVPRGPLLVSFVARLGAPGAPSSRVWRAARRVGAAAGRVRGLGPATDDRVQFDRAIGFVRPFAPAELDAMAAALGRVAVHEPDPGFPHATFLTPSS